jgi:predicted DCC family thiol-disulfide oxidoreductase YuxK
MPPAAVTLPLTIYFDGSCRLCASEIANLAERAVLGQLVLIDCSPPDFDAHGLPASREQMMNVIHARDASGQWIKGVDVFIAAYRAADLGWVARFLAHAGLRPHADRAYPWLVRNRHRISALGLHRLLNFFTHRASRANAERAYANSRACHLNQCKEKP